MTEYYRYCIVGDTHVKVTELRGYKPGDSGNTQLWLSGVDLSNPALSLNGFSLEEQSVCPALEDLAAKGRNGGLKTTADCKPCADGQPCGCLWLRRHHIKLSKGRASH